MSPLNSILAGVFKALLVIVFTISFWEVTLRVEGYRPWTPPLLVGREVVEEPDPTLGWKNKVGKYYLIPTSGSPDHTVMTIWPGGMRSTQPLRSAKTRHMTFVGCSFTQGTWLNDEETFAWKLQGRMPEFEIRNYGTAAYGTCQSLLLLMKLLDENPPPALVVYGFCDFHECRNVARWDWLRLLTINSIHGQVGMPFALSSKEGGLEFKRPVYYPDWPLKRSLATITFAEEVSMRIQSVSRSLKERATTERLMIEMDRLCAQKGSKLLVAILWAEKENRFHYESFFKRNNLLFVDCVPPNFRNPKFYIPGEGHPNGQMNASWANCLESPIKEELIIDEPSLAKYPVDTYASSNGNLKMQNPPLMPREQPWISSRRGE